MAIKQINKEDWQPFFDSFSHKYLKDDQPEYAEIRILSAESGAQPQTEWLVLEGLTFNAKEDLLDIRVEGLNRMILNPSQVYVDEDTDGWITSMEIVESDGTKDIIELR
ncbi:DUF5335 family protein [Fodinibius sediminis]|uniref:Uncharacterized protein n=1 Tax=Fodinibius sediminis TaxID=1214077 RepID=A0A521CVJ2_9BACT|nr:DUF5335 family protein [Fodinibius sediminis]SMO63479.1 hypothetical protein SAMN06265218_107150 [Fodinibius sediminis]